MVVFGFILAALVGISLGLIGGGGSILTVPILVYIMGINPVLATSYSLFIVGTTSLVGALQNYRRGNVNVKFAFLFGLSSITTVYITRKFLLPQIPSVLFTIEKFSITHSMVTMVLFAILMLLASVTMIRDKNERNNLEFDNTKIEANVLKLLRSGIFVGLATGILGAGGGFLIIPALVIILKMQMKQAVGTSLLIIALNSLVGFIGDRGHFIINWDFLILISLVAIGGIFIGGSLAKKVEGERLKKAFGWFVLIMGIVIIVRELFFGK